MGKLHKNILILITVCFLTQESAGAALDTKVPLKEPMPVLTPDSKPVSISRRQVNNNPASFGFQHNVLRDPPPSGGNVFGNSNNYFLNQPPPSQQSSLNNNYDAMRSNHLNYRDPDPYYPASSSYPSHGTGRSSGTASFVSNPIMSGGGGNYYDQRGDRDRDRDRDYRDRERDRQPYYDDYRSSSYNNQNYQRDREMALAQSREYSMRNGQLRHQEYQKRIGQSGGQEFYDPFFFIGMRAADPSHPSPSSVPLSSSLSNGGRVEGGIGSSSSGGIGLAPSPSSLPLPSSTGSSPSSSAAAPLRNRRNSHQRPDDFLFSNDISGGKYDIMTPKNAYPPLSRHQQTRPNQRDEFGISQRRPNHNLDHQFLTREQVTRQRPDSRVPYPMNGKEFGSPVLSSASGQPWSVRIGTQLKVNDDGRSPNPHRFYVRDEINPAKSRSRYSSGPIYRRRK